MEMPHFKVEIYKWELLLPLSLEIYLCDMYESSEMWDLGMQFLTDSIFRDGSFRVFKESGANAADK